MPIPLLQSALRSTDAVRAHTGLAVAFAVACCCMVAPLLGGFPEIVRAETANAPFWTAGKTQVFSILDRPGGMSIDLFSGSASADERGKYFTDGKADASINVFLLRIDGKNILVDTGFGTTAPGESGLIPALDKLGLAPESVDVVLLTHMHMDHAGGLLIHRQRAFPKAHVMVAKPELEYWLALADQEPENANARLVKTVTEVYGNDMLPPFSFGEELFPGVTALDASGHTPGHTALHITAEDKGLLIIGDLVHAAALQFALPQECASYDIDRDKAITSRVKILTMASEKDIPVAGMHIPFPGYGSVKKLEQGFQLMPGAIKK